MSMKRIGRIILWVLALAAVMITMAAAEREIPDALRVTQEIVSERLENYKVLTQSVLHSSREDVDEAINARVAALTEEVTPLIPAGKDFNTRPAHGDIVTQITRTGSRWMSFHIVALASANDNQVWSKSEEYTYDMETGRLIHLGEIIREDGWEKLLQEIRAQLAAMFPEDEPDESALDALCSREDLEGAGFVMTPGHLALYFPAGGVYPAHAEALLRAEIYVPELWEILTEEARQETDCSGYAMIALTYDDGPAKGTTRRVLNATVCHAAQVTFFTIGHRLAKNAELLHREFDGGHSVQSHSWTHDLQKINAKNEAKWEERFNQTMGNMIGTVPIMMRPPGGQDRLFRTAGCTLPMILWETNSQDAAKGDIYPEDMISCSGNALGAKDGDIVLFHDVKNYAGELAELCMKRFEEWNILLVTVNDLCAVRGVSLEDGLVLRSCPPDGGE